MGEHAGIQIDFFREKSARFFQIGSVLLMRQFSRGMSGVPFLRGRPHHANV